MGHTTGLPDPLDEYWDWQRLAACRTLPDSLRFHPDAERDPSRGRRADRAKAVCGRCPVRTRCLEHNSLVAEEPYGTWGGVDERERRALLLERRAADRTAAGTGQAPADRDDQRGA